MQNLTPNERELYETLKELRSSLPEYDRRLDDPIDWPERVDKAFQTTDTVLEKTENKADSSLGSTG